MLLEDQRLKSLFRRILYARPAKFVFLVAASILLLQVSFSVLENDVNRRRFGQDEREHHPDMDKANEEYKNIEEMFSSNADLGPAKKKDCLPSQYMWRE
jgi:hypothetical protein